jgi:hypothetical protein
MHVVLKTGAKPEAGEEDHRTVYDGRISKGIGTSFRDDQWTRLPHGGTKEKLLFALHVHEGYLSDVIQEYCEFKAAFASGEAKQTFADFLDNLRSTYMDSMPNDAEGFVFYVFNKDKRAYKGVSAPVTHRQRYG